MERCDNCQKQLPTEKFDLHLAYCKRNIIKCKQCQRPYDQNQHEQHTAEYHQIQKCKYCQIDIAADGYDHHVRGCSNRPVQCMYCQNGVPTHIFEEHLRICQARTAKCEICNKSIVNRDYMMHVSNCVGIPEESSSYGSYDTSNPYGSTGSYTTGTPQRNGSTSSYTYNSSYTMDSTWNTGSVSSPTEPRVISRRVIGTRVLYPGATDTQSTELRNYQNIGHYQIPSPSTSYQSSSYMGSQEDAGMEAALLASLGYTDILTAAQYDSIKKQQQIEKQFVKK